ncbi:MAG: hypothetical protein EOP46_06185 [Sphingobacteriaceae bacterium]|nr:MAG: hypothetical protein EOP46_06185 [Sphingobacteriaceae bacterium]
MLTWNAPTGNWTVLRIGHTAVGQQNHSAPASGTGLDCDKFSQKAFDFHFEKMFEKLMPSLTGLAENGKVGLLIDSYEMGLQNWTEGMIDAFDSRHSYSIINYLPALTGRVIGSAQITEMFLNDFRRTHAELMAVNYYQRFHELCKKHKLISYTEPYSGGVFEEMQVGQKLDISMGEFWAGLTVLWPNSSLQRTVKLASSIAHAKGETVVGAESFTAEPLSGKWQQYPYSMKAKGDLMFTKGLTRIIFHRYAHQPHPDAKPGMTMGPWGIHFDRTNTWWKPGKAWITYLTRCQHLLRQGAPVADLAYYTGEELPGETLIPENTPFAPPPGYDYDLINSETLLSATITNARLTTSLGLQYRLLVIPFAAPMSFKVLRKLSELVKQGLFIVGRKPSGPIGLADYSVHLQAFEDLTNNLWYSSNSVFENSSLEDVLRQLNILPDFTYSSASGDAPVNYIHRTNEGDDIYFIANQRRTVEQLFCEFRINGKAPSFWNPDTGEITPARVYQSVGELTRMSLTMAASGSVFVVFSNKYQSEKSYLTIIKDGLPLLPNKRFENTSLNSNRGVINNFTYTAWIKPEIDIALSEEEFFGKNLTDHYAIFPADGEQYFGKGHGIAGFTTGRNGIALYHGSTGKIKLVLVIKQPITGWTHLAIVYNQGKPSVYLNGVFFKCGEGTEMDIHPGIGLAFQQHGASYFNGEMEALQMLPKVIELQAIVSIYKKGVPAPQMPFTIQPIAGDNKEFLLWENAHYTLRSSLGKEHRYTCTAIDEPANISDDWQVSFPPASGAPANIALQRLQSLHKHDDPGVRYFSGTAIYQKTVSLFKDAMSSNKSIFLDLGRVEVIAVIKVNQKSSFTLWKPPYLADITAYLQPGKNTIEIQVTNLWPNRLIGDEQLPEENEYNYTDIPGKFASLFNGGIKKWPDWYVKGLPKPAGGRTTFTTWKHYDKNSPLLESGLLGPVYLRTAIKI